VDWRFDAAKARRVRQPVLVVLGEVSAALHPRFEETYRLLMSWLQDAEGCVLPDASHFLQASIQPAWPRRSTTSGDGIRSTSRDVVRQRGGGSALPSGNIPTRWPHVRLLALALVQVILYTNEVALPACELLRASARSCS
jgi:hypothetical protein